MIYKASLDKKTRGRTAAVSVLFIILIQVAYSNLKDEGYISAIVSIVLVLVYIAMFLKYPMQYIINDDEVIIHLPFSKVNLKKSDIVTVEKISKEDVGALARTSRVGGLFGFMRRYFNRSTGNIIWYATRKDNAVLLVTNGKRNILLTPDDMDEFIDEARR